MNTTTTPTAAPAPAAGVGIPTAPAAAPAVIRRIGGAEESAQDRLVKKHLPAWVISGAVHVGLVAVLMFVFGSGPIESKAADKILTTTVEKAEELPTKDLTNEDFGLESNLPAALPNIEKLDQRNVDALITNDPQGVPNTTDTADAAYIPPGVIASELPKPGAAGKDGMFRTGDGGDRGVIAASFLGRSGGTKNRLLMEGGGNEESERRVALGLAWLARRQKDDGHWEFDGSETDETIAATGMALLPFLAAGQTHKAGRYQQYVEKGLRYLIKHLNTSTGKFNQSGTRYMYGHGIATMALCEAYGMTRDKPFLLGPAQAAINFIHKSQGRDGSWGYLPNTTGDTSIVGWQVQALTAARLAKDIVVDDKTVTQAITFLNRVSSGSRKAVYGYASPNGKPGTSLTAVGLLCRYYVDKWGPGHAGMADGVEGLAKRGPLKTPEKPDMYYYYYATQVVHFFEGPEWKDWNEGPMRDGKRSGGMRDWLIGIQVMKEGPNYGSWDPDNGSIGSSCGRLGTTCLSLLTLEVYYRHLPLYKRDTSGSKILDGSN